MNRRYTYYCAYIVIVLMTTTALSGCALMKQWRASVQAQELEEEFSTMAHQRTESGVPAWTVEVVEGGNVRLVMRAMFESDEATLDADAEARLNPIIENLKKHSKNMVSIFGYADNTESKNYNHRLSVRRARLVAGYMTAHGIAAERVVKVAGRGETQPIASNETAVGRAKNRRVAIFVILPASGF